MSEVSDLLYSLHDGSMTVQEVAARFRTVKWPKAPTRPQTYEAVMTADMGDPTPELEGSFDEVSAAYATNQITEEQYAVLAKAAAQGFPKSKPSGSVKK